MRHCGGYRIAVISDTHNLLRPEVADVIKTCDAVLHGGDISGPDTLAGIQALCGESASVRVGGAGNFYAVRGNNDRNWASDIPYAREVRLYGCRFFMTHMKKDIPAVVDADVVIYGHSHRYAQEYRDGKLFLNPGSCGPRRFGQAITMAVLTIPDSESEEAVKPSAIIVEKIEIPHESVSGAGRSSGITGRGQSMGTVIERKEQVSGDLIREIGADLEKHRTVSEIASRRKLSMELAEQIVRLYVTHPGVTPEQIMSKMGL